MNSSDYTYLLNKPDAVNDRQTVALEEIVSEFPYFQSARALRLKGLYNQNSFQYNYALKIAAAYTTDRSVLFDFITSDTFTAIHKGLYEQKLAELHGIEVNGSEILKDQSGEAAVDKIEQSILSLIKESETPFDFTLADEEIEIEEAEISPEEITPEEIVPEEITPDETIIVSDNFAPAEIQPEVLTVEEKTTDTPEGILAEAEPAMETPEEKLEIGKPLEFSRNETHSFQEWLQLSQMQPIDRNEPPQGDDAASHDEAAEPNEEKPSADELEKIKKTEIIDRFIEANPKIPPVKPNAKPSVIAEAKEDHSALMTETLARVYLEQKKYQKAIQAYEILILKYPEKSTFFADRISEIKNLQQNNT